MNIYSPSYKRAKEVKTHKLIPDLVYCVHEFEAGEYKAEGHKVEVIPNDIRGNLSKVRNYILNNYIGDRGVMVDDDIEAFKRWELKEGEAKAVNIKDMTEFIECGFILCEEAGSHLWGINIIRDKGAYREYTPLSFNNYISGSFMGFLNNDIRFDESLPLKEDYDYSIMTANKYRKLLRINYAFMVKKDHANIGGCADTRTIEVEQEQMKLFINKWGNRIVRIDESKKKGSKKMRVYDINPVIKIPIKGV